MEDKINNYTADQLLEAYLKRVKNVIREETEKKVEKELIKKFSKTKGKNIEVGIYCTMCTQNFIIKGKNNKSVADSKQICPHIISKTWEVKHNE